MRDAVGSRGVHRRRRATAGVCGKRRCAARASGTHRARRRWRRRGRGRPRARAISFPLELQFNVEPDGATLPVLSASVRFQPRDWKSDGGREAVGHLAGWLQACGLADERCRLLAQAVFAKRMERGGKSATASCFPAFVKLRWCEDMEPCAKAYLLVRVE